MNDAKDFQGWDLWAEGGKVATHIIHRWDGDALKVVSTKKLTANAWNHVFVTYDGSSKAAGVSIYLDGKLQTATVANDRLKGSIRTEVALKLGQRHNTSVVENVQYPRPPDLQPGVDRRRGRHPGRHEPGVRRLSPSRRTPDRADVEAIFAWYLGNRDEPTRGSSRPGPTRRRSHERSKAAGPSPMS